MLFTGEIIYAYPTGDIGIFFDWNIWDDNFGSLLSADLFYFAKKNSVIKADSIFFLWCMYFGYQFSNIFRLDSFLSVRWQRGTYC